MMFIAPTFMEFHAKSHFSTRLDIIMLIYCSILEILLLLRDQALGIAVSLEHVIYEITVSMLLNTPKILFFN